MNKILYTLAAALMVTTTACDENDSIPGWPWLDRELTVTCGDNVTKADYDKDTKTFTFTVGTDEAPASSFSMTSVKFDADNNVVPVYLAVDGNEVIELQDEPYTLVEAGAVTEIELAWESVWTVTVNTKKNTISAVASTPQPRTETNPEIVALGWTNVSEEFGELPLYISIYKSPETLEGQKANAYIAVANTAKGGAWDVLGDFYHCDDEAVDNDAVDEAYTPSEFYEQDGAPVIINGGLFFWTPKSDGGSCYVSQNLIYRNGEVLASNQTYSTEDWATFQYPTLGAFYETADGTFGTTWTYYVWPGTNYSYDEPNKNLSESPDASDTPFEAKTAIGGVGVLLHNGMYANTWEYETLDVVANSRQPRTAIGVTADKRLIFFVCQGRSEVLGFTTDELAKIFQSLHCVDALNLDGGGSSCMVVNGEEVFTPSDGEQRSVASALKMF